MHYSFIDRVPFICVSDDYVLHTFLRLYSKFAILSGLFACSTPLICKADLCGIFKLLVFFHHHLNYWLEPVKECWRSQKRVFNGPFARFFFSESSYRWDCVNVERHHLLKMLWNGITWTIICGWQIAVTAVISSSWEVKLHPVRLRAVSLLPELYSLIGLSFLTVPSLFSSSMRPLASWLSMMQPKVDLPQTSEWVSCTSDSVIMCKDPINFLLKLGPNNWTNKSIFLWWNTQLVVPKIICFISFCCGNINTSAVTSRTI